MVELLITPNDLENLIINNHHVNFEIRLGIGTELKQRWFKVAHATQDTIAYVSDEDIIRVKPYMATIRITQK